MFFLHIVYHFFGDFLNHLKPDFLIRRGCSRAPKINENDFFLILDARRRKKGRAYISYVRKIIPMRFQQKQLFDTGTMVQSPLFCDVREADFKFITEFTLVTESTVDIRIIRLVRAKA